MNNKNLTRLYARYSAREILFKYLTTRLLSFRITRALSVSILKWLLRFSHGAVCKTVNKIYFCGECLTSARATASVLARQGISSVLDYAVEGQDDDTEFDKALDNTLRLIDIASQSENIPFVVVKPSSLASELDYENRDEIGGTASGCNRAWQRVEGRYRRIFDSARRYRVRVMVDAETSTIQRVVDPFIIRLMREYNTEWPVITLTLQFYLKAQQDNLHRYYELARQYNFKLGVKVVRGAYLEAEKVSGNARLCFTDKSDTDASYDEAVDYISHRLDVIYPFFATHNEQSLNLIMQNERLNAAQVWTGQLYGIGDHITSSLQSMDFRVCKYLPYGPVDKSLPYLLRRIEENAVSPETFSKESPLLRRELWRRLSQGGKTCA